MINQQISLQSFIIIIIIIIDMRCGPPPQDVGAAV